MRLKADGNGICNAEKLAKLVGPDKKAAKDLGVTSGGNANGHTMRRAFMRGEIKNIVSPMDLDGNADPEVQAELKKLRAELAELEDE